MEREIIQILIVYEDIYYMSSSCNALFFLINIYR